METNSPQICKWTRVATSGSRAQTWCRLNNHTSSTRLCKAAGAPSPPLGAAPRMHFAASSTAMRAHTYKCAPETLVRCLGVYRAVEGTNPGRPLVRKAPHRSGTGSNSVTRQRLQRSRPVAERGRGRSGRPSHVPWTHPPQSPKASLLHPHLPRRRLHDAEGTSILPRLRR